MLGVAVRAAARHDLGRSSALQRSRHIALQQRHEIVTYLAVWTVSGVRVGRTRVKDNGVRSERGGSRSRALERDSTDP